MRRLPFDADDVQRGVRGVVVLNARLSESGRLAYAFRYTRSRMLLVAPNALSAARLLALSE
jgi:uncharacterized lipoprotein YbaY